jgi:hypothetical protein
MFSNYSRTVGFALWTLKKGETHRRHCKMSSSKKIDLYRDFTAGIYLFKA